jgi:hypothetical protein
MADYDSMSFFCSAKNADLYTLVSRIPLMFKEIFIDAWAESELLFPTVLMTICLQYVRRLKCV